MEVICSGGATGGRREDGVWRRASMCYVTSCAEVTVATSAEELLKHGARAEAVAHEQTVAALRERECVYLLRDSKDPEGPVLIFTLAEWVTFTAGIKAGEFEPEVPAAA